MKNLTKFKIVISTLVSLLFISCEDTKQGASLSFDLRLPQDKNGFYHLTLDNSTWQTLHRVSGKITNQNGPLEGFWVNWDSDLHWYLDDTLGYVVNRGWNYITGEYVSKDTSYMVGFSGMEVPTSNKASYSNSKGEINNMIAPVRSMVGDTLFLTAEWFDGYQVWGIVLK